MAITHKVAESHQSTVGCLCISVLLCKNLRKASEPRSSYGTIKPYLENQAHQPFSNRIGQRIPEPGTS